MTTYPLGGNKETPMEKDYIGMKTIAKSLFNKIEYRTSEKEGRRVIEALIPFNTKSADLGGFKEIITETAFRKTINDGANIYAYYNHDDGKVLGSTHAETLELRNERDGLYCKLYLGNTSYANDAWDIISRKDCTTLSFGFIPHEVENRGNLRYLKSVQLKEISFCVTQPAYEATSSIAYTRKKKDYIGMNKSIITRSINTELLEEIISSGKLIEDEEAAKELLSLIAPDLLKKLTAVESAPAGEAERENTEEKEQQAKEEEEKKKLLEQLEAELKSELKETEEEEEEEEEKKE
jgi:HK97 family phage prohead protease